MTEDRRTMGQTYNTTQPASLLILITTSLISSEAKFGHATKPERAKAEQKKGQRRVSSECNNVYIVDGPGAG